MRRAKWAAGEYLFYLFLSFSYLAYLSFYVQLKYMGGAQLDYIGILEGVFFLLLTVLFIVLYSQPAFEDLFTEFKDKFRR